MKYLILLSLLLTGCSPQVGECYQTGFFQRAKVIQPLKFGAIVEAAEIMPIYYNSDKYIPYYELKEEIDCVQFEKYKQFATEKKK